MPDTTKEMLPQSVLPEWIPAARDGFYQSILDGLSDGVYFVDRERNIKYWNRGAERISGYGAGEVLGRSCRENLLVHVDRHGCELCVNGCPLLATLGDGNVRQADVFLKHHDGERVPVSVRVAPIVDGDGEIVGCVEIFSDNSTKLAALERAAEMERAALIDLLTSAGTRRYTEEVLNEHWRAHRAVGNCFALMFLDVDHFKQVNDTYGHAAGDAILRAVSGTILKSLRSFDFLGRWGGDEFVIISPALNPDEALTIAERCLKLVRSCAIPWKDEIIRPTVSIGVAAIQRGDSVQDLLARADQNLYRAKIGGRNRIYGTE